jgi:hypothetical protein
MEMLNQKAFAESGLSYVVRDKGHVQDWLEVDKSGGVKEIEVWYGPATRKVVDLFPGQIKSEVSRAQAIIDEYFGKFRDLCSSLDHIRNLPEDWDGEGAPAYGEETITRATGFLLSFIRDVYDSYHLRLPLPKILPGPDGSIDIHWKGADFELLLNIPPNDKYAQFYGDNKFGESVKGVINIDLSYPNVGLILWLRDFR